MSSRVVDGVGGGRVSIFLQCGPGRDLGVRLVVRRQVSLLASMLQELAPRIFLTFVVQVEAIVFIRVDTVDVNHEHNVTPPRFVSRAYLSHIFELRDENGDGGIHGVDRAAI